MNARTVNKIWTGIFYAVAALVVVTEVLVAAIIGCLIVKILLFVAVPEVAVLESVNVLV